MHDTTLTPVTFLPKTVLEALVVDAQTCSPGESGCFQCRPSAPGSSTRLASVGTLFPDFPGGCLLGKKVSCVSRAGREDSAHASGGPSYLLPQPPMSILLLDGLWAQAGGSGPPVELCLRLASQPQSSWTAWLTALSPCIMGSRTSLSFRISNATGSGWKLYHF